jgi:hypothetical protein
MRIHVADGVESIQASRGTMNLFNEQSVSVGQQGVVLEVGLKWGWKLGKGPGCFPLKCSDITLVQSPLNWKDCVLGIMLDIVTLSLQYLAFGLFKNFGYNL